MNAHPECQTGGSRARRLGQALGVPTGRRSEVQQDGAPRLDSDAIDPDVHGGLSGEHHDGGQQAGHLVYDGQWVVQPSHGLGWFVANGEEDGARK